MIFKAIKTAQSWFKIVEVERLQRYLDKYPIDQPLDVSIDKPKQRRNTSQNSMLHAIFMELDRLMHNNDQDRTKWQVLIEVGFYEEFEINGRLERLPKRTSKLEKKEFSELIQRIIDWAWEFNQWDVRHISQRGYE